MSNRVTRDAARGEVQCHHALSSAQTNLNERSQGQRRHTCACMTRNKYHCSQLTTLMITALQGVRHS